MKASLIAWILLLSPALAQDAVEPAPVEEAAVIVVPVGSLISQAAMDGATGVVVTAKDLYRVDAERALHRVADAPASPCIDAARRGERVVLLLRAKERREALLLLDIASGEPIARYEFEARARRDVGFIDDERVWVLTGRDCEIIALESGEVVHRMEAGGGVLMAGFLQDGKLYGAREYAGGIAVFDLATGTLDEMIDTRDWLFGIQMVGTLAIGMTAGHGYVTFDLSDRPPPPEPVPEGNPIHDDWKGTQMPVDEELGAVRGLLVRADSAIFATFPDAVARLGPDLAPIAVERLSERVPGPMVGFLGDRVVLRSDDALYFVSVE